MSIGRDLGTVLETLGKKKILHAFSSIFPYYLMHDAHY
jgi:hypothetical protein